jgi:hypothetical protein
MVFERNVVVVGRDHRLPTHLRPQHSRQHETNLLSHRLAGRVGKTTSAGGVVKIFETRIGFGVERAKPLVHRLRTFEMVIADRLPEGPRPAMHHQPEPSILVRLNFNEVISAAEGCELDRASAPTHGLQAGMAKRFAHQVPGLRYDRTAIAPAGRHGPAEIGQDLPGDSRSFQRRSLKVQPHRQHPTSYVASDSLRIDQMRRGDDQADAHVGGQMNVGHYGYLLNIGGAPEAFDRLRHVTIHWRCQPCPDGRHRGFTHDCLHPEQPAQKTTQAPVSD